MHICQSITGKHLDGSDAKLPNLDLNFLQALVEEFAAIVED